ncbi:MAG: glycosyltransferase family 39 protein, partial [Planctomycetota bacterium]
MTLRSTDSAILRGTHTSFTLAAILLVAIVLRIWGAAWAWPYGFWGDEALYMPNAFRMLADRDFNTHSFHNSHLLTYVYCAEIAVAFVVLAGLGVTSTPAAFGTFVWRHTPAFQLLGRVTVGLSGAVTVFFLFRFAKPLFGQRAALLSAWFLAVSFLHTRNSHIAVNDVPMTMFLVIAATSSFGLVDSPSFRRSVLAGVGTGLAIGTKYNAGVFLLVPVAALAMSCLTRDSVSRFVRFARLRGVLRLTAYTVVVCLVAAGVFVLSNPFSVLSFSEFWAGFTRQVSYGASPWPTQSPQPVAWQLLSALHYGLGIPVLVFALIGSAMALRTSPRYGLLLILFVCAYLLAMGRQSLFFPRFVIPALPFVCTLAGIGADAIVRTVTIQVSAIGAIGRWCCATSPTIVTVVVAAIGGGPALARSVYLDALLTRPTTQQLTIDWFESRQQPVPLIVGEYDTIGGYGASLSF